jgi:hypothetical protein
VAITVVTDSGTSDFRTLTWNCGTLAVNDIIVVTILTEDASLRPMNAPTATGVTFTNRVLDATASHDWAAIYTGVVTSAGAKTVTSTPNWASVSALHGGTAIVFPTADGYSLAGSPVTVDTRGTGAPSATITCTAGSVIAAGNGDWAAVSGSSRTYNTTSATPTEDAYGFVTGASTNYFWHQTAVAGSNTIGLTAPTGQTFTTFAVEVLFSGGAAAPIPNLTMAPMTGA